MSIGVSKTTVHRWIVASMIHVHCNSLKPILTEENKCARFEMALSFRDPANRFFLMREKERYLLHHGEKYPKCCVKHKSHITKVMFLCAVARPHFNTSLNSWWDRNLGIWPIGDWEPAKRKSKNRPKGTLVWKNKIVMKEVYRDLLITKFIPAILEKWPTRDRNVRKIFIQQDGAKNHIREDDKLLNDALEENGVNVELYTQSASSPDINLLDLGFFRAIQSFNDAAPRNEEELIEAVSEAYDKYPREKINRT